MKKLAFLLVALTLSSIADANDVPPNGGWDRGGWRHGRGRGPAQAGELCSDPSGYYRPCSPGLVCTYAPGRHQHAGYGVCQYRGSWNGGWDNGRNNTGWDNSYYCRSDYDCSRNHYCMNGVCVDRYHRPPRR